MMREKLKIYIIGSINQIFNAQYICDLPRMNHFPEEIQTVIRSKDFLNKICLFSGYWKVSDCIENPKSLFLFGDNDLKRGKKGQAIIRDCVNTHGIPTKKFPSNNHDAYYSDDQYDENCKKIIMGFVTMIKKSSDYQEIAFPGDGFGTGLAQLGTKAPQTFAFLNTLIERYFGIDYQDILKNGLKMSLSESSGRAQELADACDKASIAKNEKIE